MDWIQISSIHHPFLLSDNRHYMFYIWRRVFMLHTVVPYLFIPGYQACAWAWWIRVGKFPVRWQDSRRRLTLDVMC